MTPNTKNKWSFLSHLKLGSIFYFVEIDLRQIVNQKTLEKYKDTLYEREQIRLNIKLEENYYHKLVKNQISKEENNYKHYNENDNQQQKPRAKRYYSNESSNLDYENYISSQTDIIKIKEESNEKEIKTDKTKIMINSLLEGKDFNELLYQESQRKKFEKVKDQFPTFEEEDEVDVKVDQKTKKGGGAKKKKKKFEELKI